VCIAAIDPNGLCCFLVLRVDIDDKLWIRWGLDPPMKRGSSPLEKSGNSNLQPEIYVTCFVNECGFH